MKTTLIIRVVAIFTLASLLGGCAAFRQPDPVWICGNALMSIEETPPAAAPAAAVENPDEEVIELTCGPWFEPIEPRKRAEAMVMW